MSADLIDAELRRAAGLARLLRGARLAGTEELLQHLDQLAADWEADESLKRLCFIPPRLVADFETALEATLSGYFTVAADAMRDAMEIENQLDDFALDPARVDAWLAADRSALVSDFGPAKIRARLAQRGRAGTEQAKKDYQAHSAALHFNPIGHRFPMTPKGRVKDWEDAGFWELFEHARRVLAAVDRAASALATDPGAISPSQGDAHLPRMKEAAKRTQEMIRIYVELLRVSHSNPSRRRP